MPVGLDETVTASGPAPSPVRTTVPAQISRFEVEDRLGEGGHGLVLLARDPGLDRRVAIKILRRDDDEARRRLLREAQSAAKVVHDNIIVIHEVGTHEDGVYLAMEYIAGAPLSRWQVGRSWREVLDCYLRAGRGLAAAHAAGMVHRDFKPDNVLVGDDGRVRVTDFGLVSVAGVELETSGPPGDAALATTLTRTGAVMGTPRYMAPEQHLAEPVDARADEFAFCVALYEGLFGRRPFAGDTYRELSDRVVDGKLVPPPGDSPVPRAIRKAILRGLSRHRDDRFASMTDLLAALSPAPRRWSRWWIALAAGVLAVAAAAAVLWPRTTATEPHEAAFAEAREALARSELILAFERAQRGMLLRPTGHVLGEADARMIYDLAASFERSGDCQRARFAYEAYLNAGSDSAKRTQAQVQLAALGACDASTSAQASEAYKAGESAYSLGQFDTAIREFRRAFTLEPNLKVSTAYLYNLGMVYRQTGNCAEALQVFEKYLALRTDLRPQTREQTVKFIAEAKQCLATRRAE